MVKGVDCDDLVRDGLQALKQEMEAWVEQLRQTKVLPHSLLYLSAICLGGRVIKAAFDCGCCTEHITIDAQEIESVSVLLFSPTCPAERVPPWPVISHCYQSQITCASHGTWCQQGIHPGLSNISVHRAPSDRCTLSRLCSCTSLTEHSICRHCACIIYEGSVCAMYSLSQKASQAASYNTMQIMQGIWRVPSATPHILTLCTCNPPSQSALIYCHSHSLVTSTKETLHQVHIMRCIKFYPAEQHKSLF